MHIPNKGWFLWTLIIFTLTMVLLLFYIHENNNSGSYTFMIFQKKRIPPLTQQHKSAYCGFPRVMCMIFITVKNWSKRGEAVRRTWSRHCHRRLFFYSRQDLTEVPDDMKDVANESVALNVSEGRAHLTTKTMAALDYSFRNYEHDVDWFLKADDDVYIVYENLIQFLSTFDHLQPYYLGSTAKTQNHVPNGYNLGGAGYLLSHTAAAMVINKGRRLYPALCAGLQVGGSEDVDMADCLQKFNIYPANTQDSKSRDRFESQNPLRLLQGLLGESSDKELNKYRSAEYQGKQFGDYANTKKTRMMGNESISFHYVSPALMYMYDFLLNLLPNQKPRRPLDCDNNSSPSHRPTVTAPSSSSRELEINHTASWRTLP